MDTAPAQAPPRILLLTSQYFLLGEVAAACARLGVPHLLLDLQAREMELDAFVRLIDETLGSFRPDFVLTVNHLGLDREGVLAQLLDRAHLPLASWFVDNPHLILPLYRGREPERLALFTFDADTTDSLRAEGYRHVFFLPLGTDPTRFRPGGRLPDPAWRSRVSFVGNSMLVKTARRLEAASPDSRILARFSELAAGFGESSERSALRFVATRHPELRPDIEALGSDERKLALETALAWQATLLYRRDCVTRLLPFAPLIVGDPGWKDLLRDKDNWRSHPELGYYADLPDFYPLSEINFNCTNRQMPGAVNQRVFDVPACGAFLLTDHRRQLEDLFEPGREVACFREPAEIEGLVERFLAAPQERRRIAEAARRRVLSEHTYDRRITALIQAMRQLFG